MLASVYSLLKCLATHLSWFLICAALFTFSVSCSYIWQDAKAPAVLLADTKAPNVETATDTQLYDYIRLLDANLEYDLFTLSFIDDPIQRAPLKKRIHSLFSEWCKFMRIRTGRLHEMWVFDYYRQV